MRNCVAKLKPGAPFLVYLYYALDDRPAWFRAVWRLSDLFRRGISKLPFRVKLSLTSAMAVTLYWPLARVAKAAERWGSMSRIFR